VSAKPAGSAVFAHARGLQHRSKVGGGQAEGGHDATGSVPLRFSEP